MLSCNHGIHMVSAHEAPTFTVCIVSAITCQPVQWTEKHISRQLHWSSLSPRACFISYWGCFTVLHGCLATCQSFQSDSKWGLQLFLSIRISASYTFIRATVYILHSPCHCCQYYWAYGILLHPVAVHAQRLWQLPPKPQMAPTLSQPDSRCCCGETGW